MLVAMATGTGKTYTLVNQVYRYMKSGVASGFSSWLTGGLSPRRR